MEYEMYPVPGTDFQNPADALIIEDKRVPGALLKRTSGLRSVP